MWGCLFADIVAVPVPPPNPERLSSSLPSFNRILEDSGAVAILTDYKFEILVRAAPLTVLAADTVPHVYHSSDMAMACATLSTDWSSGPLQHLAEHSIRAILMPKS